MVFLEVLLVVFLEVLLVVFLEVLLVVFLEVLLVVFLEVLLVVFLEVLLVVFLEVLLVVFLEVLLVVFLEVLPGGVPGGAAGGVPGETERINTDIGGNKIPLQYIVVLEDSITVNASTLEDTFQALSIIVEGLGAEIFYTYNNTISGFAFRASNQLIAEQIISALELIHGSN